VRHNRHRRIEITAFLVKSQKSCYIACHFVTDPWVTHLVLLYPWVQLSWPMTKPIPVVWGVGFLLHRGKGRDKNTHGYCWLYLHPCLCYPYLWSAQVFWWKQVLDHPKWRGIEWVMIKTIKLIISHSILNHFRWSRVCLRDHRYKNPYPYPYPYLPMTKTCTIYYGLHVYYTPPLILKDSSGLLLHHSSTTPQKSLFSPQILRGLLKDSSRTPQGVYQLQIKDSLGSPQGVLKESSGTS